MIVFLAGMQRSGSTFSFNVVRDILARRGTVYQEAHPSAAAVVERSGDADHVLFKAHNTDGMTVRLVKLGAVKAVLTVRRPEDAIASWIETFGFDLDTSIAHFQDWLSMFARLRNHALVVRYDDIERLPWSAAWRIARYVCPDARLIEVMGIARARSKRRVKAMTDKLNVDDENVQHISFSYYDTKTFFHRRHVSSLASRFATERIGADAVSTIRHAFRGDIDKNGNLL